MFLVKASDIEARSISVAARTPVSVSHYRFVRLSPAVWGSWENYSCPTIKLLLAPVQKPSRVHTSTDTLFKLPFYLF